MPKPLNLVHLANFNSTNIGNGALISGLEYLIESDLTRDIVWLREPWDDYTFGLRQFDRQFVRLVNNSDGLIINGAVAIHGRDYLKETGLRFELPITLVEEIKKPVIFYGISYRHFKGQAFFHQDTLRNNLAYYAENPNIFLAVRNDGTKKWLRETLLLSDMALDKIHELPDSGVFVQAQAGCYPEILPGRKVIIFAANDEDAQYRYGEANVGNTRDTGYSLGQKTIHPDDRQWIQNRSRLIHAVSNALTKILRSSGAQLVLVPHYLDDLKFIASLVDSFEPRITHQSTITTGLMRGQGTSYFYGRYQQADLAISMRVHSMSPCIGLGVPMIPLITQARMWDFLSDVELDDLALDAFSADLEEKLIGQSLMLLADSSQERARFSQAKSMMREQARRINKQIGQLFGIES